MIFAPGTFFNHSDATPEQIARKRQLVAAMMPRFGSASTVGEGIGQALTGFAMGRMNKSLDRREGEGRQSARDTVAGIFNGSRGGGGTRSSGSGGGYTPPGTGATNITMTPETENPGGLDPSIIAAVDRVSPNAPVSMNSSEVSSRLMSDLQRDLGLTPEQAAGIVGNLSHETGGFEHMQEISPLVPGSRGGFGFAQWTGPRRRAYEKWAADNGLDPNSYEANYGFLNHELTQTPEGKVLADLRGAGTAADAASIFSNQFLRPGIPHMDGRIARANGVLGETMSASNAPPGTGAAPAQTGPELGDLYEALTNPWLSPDEKGMITNLINQRIQENDPMRRIELEKASLELEAMRNPAASQPSDLTEREAMARAGGLTPNTPEWNSYILTGKMPEAGYSVITGADAERMGLDPALTYNVAPDGKISQIGGGGTNVTVNNGGAPSAEPLGTKGQILVQDPNAPGGYRVELAEGSEAWRDAQAEEASEANKEREGELKLGTTLQSLNLNINEIENGGMPVTGAIGDFRRSWIGQALTGSGAVDFGNRTAQITDSAAFDEIQRMRDNSPTGGAVGQLTDNERMAIGNAVTALNNSTSAEEYLRAAKAYRELALNLAYGQGNWSLNPDGSIRSGQTAPPNQRTYAPPTNDDPLGLL